MDNFYLIFILWNIAVFLIYGIDKLKAVCDKWRISERTLIVCAFMLGAPGAIMGMKCFRHKTQKKEFKIYIFASVVFNLLILWCLKDSVF